MIVFDIWTKAVTDAGQLGQLFTNQTRRISGSETGIDPDRPLTPYGSSEIEALIGRLQGTPFRTGRGKSRLCERCLLFRLEGLFPLSALTIFNPLSLCFILIFDFDFNFDVVKIDDDGKIQ